MAYRNPYTDGVTYRAGNTRVHIKRIVYTPESEEGRVIFPYINTQRKFDTDNYDPNQTDGKLTSLEVENIMEEVAVPIKKWQEKHGYLMGENKTFNMWMCILFPIGILYGIFFHFIATMLAFENHKKACDEAKAVVKKYNNMHSDKGIFFYLPERFPQWLEIRVKAPPQPIVVLPVQQLQQLQQISPLIGQILYGAQGFGAQQIYPMMQPQQQPQYYMQPGMVPQTVNYTQIPMKQNPYGNVINV